MKGPCRRGAQRINLNPQNYISSNRKINLSNKNNKNNTKGKVLPNKRNELKKYIKILQKNDNEMNSLEYKKAKILDKRTCSQIYFSLLRENHLFIFSFFCKNKDYNVQVIKIYLFFFFFLFNLRLMLYFSLIIQFIKFIKMKENLIFYIKYNKFFIPL